MSDFSKWKETATPDEVAVSVCLNRRLFREFTEASERLEQVRESGMLDQPVEVQALAERVVDLKRQVEADQAEHTFVFACLPYTVWRDLAEAHPPSEAQKAENRYLDFDPDTFPQAAVAAACASPDLSEDDGKWLRENLPRAEFDRLFTAAMTANVGGSSLGKSVSSIVDRLASELKSITAANTESPSPSSEDE